MDESGPAATTNAVFVSRCTVYPTHPSTLGLLKLSVSDLPMLSCHYIQKGLLFPPPPISPRSLATLLLQSLSHALALFPALAGTLVTDPDDGTVFISCNDAGVPFSHCITTNPDLSLHHILFNETASGDVPESLKAELFELDGAISYDGHFRPLSALRFTELATDGSVFIGCTVNHAVVDGTSFWNFFNSWADLCRTKTVISKKPDFRRNFFADSTATLRFPEGKGPEVTFAVGAPLRERVLHFSSDAIRKLKSEANGKHTSSKCHSSLFTGVATVDQTTAAEMYGKQTHDVDETSSFQSICALLWKHVTRARKLPPGVTTTFRMAVNCRHRINPPVDPFYFGNAIQSIRTVVAAEDVACRELRWTARLLRKSVAAHVNGEVRRKVTEWERDPKCFPLGNPDGSGLTMGSSPRFPMYENDFGWGRPVAVRSGKANKFDGKMSAFPGREGDGSVDLEVCLKPETMTALLADSVFMRYVTEETELTCHPTCESVDRGY